jgi:hypothetical protein
LKLNKGYYRDLSDIISYTYYGGRLYLVTLAREPLARALVFVCVRVFVRKCVFVCATERAKI